MLINKCLFDHNVDSKKNLAHAISCGCLQASDVKTILSNTAEDTDIAEFAQKNGWTLVTKDKDFLEEYQQFAQGHPGLIWLRIGNASVSEHNIEFDRVLNKMNKQKLNNLDDKLAEVGAVEIGKYP